MERSEFEKLVKEALDSLPAHLKEALDNVGIVIERWPDVERLKESGVKLGGYLLGLYQGVPKTAWGRGFGRNLPDKITIFQDSIEKISRTPQEVKELTKLVVWHELAHHFGLDEKRVRALEEKWKKKLKQ